MLRTFVLKNPFQLFLTILLPFLVSTVLLLFLQSSLLSRNFERFALKQVYGQQLTNLQNTSSNVSALEQTAKSVSTTAFFDDVVKDLLYSDVNAEDYSKYQAKLQSYKNIYPFLQSIYVYNGDSMYTVPRTQFVQDREHFDDPGIFALLDNMETYKSHSIVLRKIPNIMSGISTGAKKDIFVYSYLFFDSQLTSGKVNEAIILNISEEWLNQSIQAQNPAGNFSRIFVIDNRGRLLSPDAVHPLLSDLHGEGYIRQINEAKDRAGSLRMNVNGVDAFVTYVSTDAFDWKLVSVTPYAHIMKDIEHMRQKTYLFVACFIIGSMLLSFYFSRRLYVPMSVVIQNYKQLESEKRNELYNRKQEFLRKLVHAQGLLPPDFVTKQFQRYEIGLDPAGHCLIVLAKIDRFSDFCSAYNRADRDLLKFGIVNIVNELLRPSYAHECIDMDEDLIAMLLQVPSLGAPSENEELVGLMRQLQAHTRQFLRLSVSITFGEPFETLRALDFHYLKTADLSDYRLMYGRNCMIFSDLTEVRTEDFQLLPEQEKALTEALVQGRFEEGKQLLGEMAQGASRYGYTAVHSMFIRQLLLIRHAVEVLESNHAMKVDFQFNAYLAKLQKLETIEDVLADYDALLDGLALELEAKRDNRYTKLLECVTRIVERELANPCLSLDAIAEEVHLSPPYLGKLFKKHRSISVADYINGERLQYAGRLVASSDDPIADIMEKSGFSSRSHFFTQFKRAYGTTPSQYRTNAKLEAGGGPRLSDAYQR
ncbi:AraC family transcriptional regulator [Paenibacillus sacheonensis]|uniref:Helix-turn-helix domain-containing protein n=1 Tax=Paenibacillus sacheonensis TaxID=742054 RepID=A0A7X4YVW0_9BACL|nr:AraC family transcriptional regulator [Paenibacillus sacheonensis]MBM7568690.1 AraC-like DNA-binding protein [Paenibacillus sacheonensis]NBC72419.1 helix-turn-helix domain-containing protein [Paenibacillus sacheonensis]